MLNKILMNLFNKFKVDGLPSISKVWYTQAMRLAIRQSLSLVALTSIAMWILYWALTQFVDAQIGSDLKYSADKFQKIYQYQGISGVVRTLHDIEKQRSTRLEGRRYYLLMNAHKKRLAGEFKDWPEDFKTFDQVKNLWIEDDLLPHTQIDRDGYWPTIAIQFSGGERLLISQSVHEAELLREFVLVVMVLLVLFIALISLYLGWKNGLKILQKVTPINLTASQIEQGNLSKRIKIPTDVSMDEFDEIALHLNKMLDTIEKLMTDMRQVTQNIAHDLRKPLTRLSARLELMEGEVSPEDLAEIKQEVQSLIQTFNALLQLGQLESGVQPVEETKVPFSELVEQLSSLYAETAQSKGLDWHCEILPHVQVQGDRQLLAQMLINLFENALKYTSVKGKVVLKLKRLENDQVSLCLFNSTDTLLDQKTLDKILMPFVRLQASRSTQGNGLGLALIKAIVRWHKGRIILNPIKTQDLLPGVAICIQLNALPSAAASL